MSSKTKCEGIMNRVPVSQQQPLGRPPLPSSSSCALSASSPSSPPPAAGAPSSSCSSPLQRAPPCTAAGGSVPPKEIAIAGLGGVPIDGPFQTYSEIDTRMVDALAAGGPPYYLVKVWNQYRESPAAAIEDAALTSAFIRAASLWARRNPDIVLPLFAALCEVPLESGDYERMALIASDLCAVDGGKQLLERSKGKRRPISFYIHLIRLAAESTRVPDMTFAEEIVEEMLAVGHMYTPPSLRILAHGYGRVQPPNIDQVIRLLLFRLAQDGNCEACLVNEAFETLERGTGENARRALEALRHMSCAMVKATIADVTERIVCEKVHSDSSQVKYWLIDPFTVDPPDEIDIEPNNYYFFFFSALRSLCARAKQCGKQHPLQVKVARLRQLFLRHKELIVMSLTQELALRVDDTSGRILDNMVGKMLYPVQVLARNACPIQCQLIVATRCPSLTAAIKQSCPLVRIVPSLPAKDPSEAVSSSATPPKISPR